MYVTRRLAALPVCLLLALSACDQGAQTPPDTKSGAQSDSSSSAPPSSNAVAQDAIPASLQGRWALKPDDCTPAGGIATGALVITGKNMRFYETVAEPIKAIQHSPTMIRALFSFSGEGVSWEREQSLELAGSQDTLVRREYGVDAPTEPFTYTKCPNGE